MLTTEQLELRRLGIGGSDAPALAQCDPYRQPLDVYLEKTDEDPPVDDLEDRKEVVRWGNLLEDAIAQEWAVRQGAKVRRVNEVLHHPEFDFVLGNIDRKVQFLREGLEVKTRGFFAAEDYGPSGGDEVKYSDIIQCQHYMAVTGWKLWHMAVLIGGQEMRSYRIPRDNSLIESLLDLEISFWDRVQKQDPPDLDFSHRSAPYLIKKLYPGTNGATVILPDEAPNLHALILAATAAKKEAEVRLFDLKNNRASLMGENAVGLMPDGSGGWRRKNISRRGYTVEPSEYMDIHFSKNLKDNS